MSKSTGNTLLPDELFSGENDVLEKGYNPIVVRFFMMQAHYRSTLDFSSEALNAAEKGYSRLMDGLSILGNIKTSDNSSEDVNGLIDSFYTAMNDDFNTPILIAKLFDAVKFINNVNKGSATISKQDKEKLEQKMHEFTFDVLGLTTIENEKNSSLDKVMELVLKMRQKARDEKDWDTADEIRNMLNEANIEIKDGKEGVTWVTK